MYFVASMLGESRRVSQLAGSSAPAAPWADVEPVHSVASSAMFGRLRSVRAHRWTQ